MQQDWETVVFKKKQLVDPTHQKCVSERTPKHIQNLNNHASEDIKNKMFDTEFIKSVTGARIKNKWSQKDLAMKLNVSASRINNFEQHKEVYDALFKNKVNNILFRENVR